MSITSTKGIVMVLVWYMKFRKAAWHNGIIVNLPKNSFFKEFLGSSFFGNIMDSIHKEQKNELTTKLKQKIGFITAIISHEKYTRQIGLNLV